MDLTSKEFADKLDDLDPLKSYRSRYSYPLMKDIVEGKKNGLRLIKKSPIS